MPGSGRSAIVVTELGGLRGPPSGQVEVPLRPFWSSPDRASTSATQRTGVACIRQCCGRRPGLLTLTDFISRGVLISVWLNLRLLAAVRRAWEELRPVLRAGCELGKPRQGCGYLTAHAAVAAD